MAADAARVSESESTPSKGVKLSCALRGEGVGVELRLSTSSQELHWRLYRVEDSQTESRKLTYSCTKESRRTVEVKAKLSHIDLALRGEGVGVELRLSTSSQELHWRLYRVEDSQTESRKLTYSCTKESRRTVEVKAKLSHIDLALRGEGVGVELRLSTSSQELHWRLYRVEDSQTESRKLTYSCTKESRRTVEVKAKLSHIDLALRGEGVGVELRLSTSSQELHWRLYRVEDSQTESRKLTYSCTKESRRTVEVKAKLSHIDLALRGEGVGVELRLSTSSQELHWRLYRVEDSQTESRKLTYSCTKESRRTVEVKAKLSHIDLLVEQFVTNTHRFQKPMKSRRQKLSLKTLENLACSF
ncbi:hypothetical protein SRHO_G00254720 [Serrasalmus rhombeus]